MLTSNPVAPQLWQKEHLSLGHVGGVELQGKGGILQGDTCTHWRFEFAGEHALYVHTRLQQP